MSELATNAFSAGELLRFALDPKETIFQNQRYAELVQQLSTNPSLRIIFDNFIEGLGLTILDLNTQGVFIGAREKSPFAFKMDSYRKANKVEERVAHGVILLTLTAYCFPTAETLDQDLAILRPRFTCDQIATYLMDLCKAAKTNTAADPEHVSVEFQTAWIYIRNQPVIKETSDGKVAQQCLTGMIQHATGFLNEQGLLRFISDDGHGTYQPTPAFRVQVRDMASHETLRVIRDLCQQGVTNG
jgi:hypothetical protein